MKRRCFIVHLNLKLFAKGGLLYAMGTRKIKPSSKTHSFCNACIHSVSDTYTVLLRWKWNGMNAPVVHRHVRDKRRSDATVMCKHKCCLENSREDLFFQLFMQILRSTSREPCLIVLGVQVRRMPFAWWTQSQSDWPCWQIFTHHKCDARIWCDPHLTFLRTVYVMSSTWYYRYGDVIWFENSIIKRKILNYNLQQNECALYPRLFRWESLFFIQSSMNRGTRSNYVYTLN